MAAMILEADMMPGEFMVIRSDKGAIMKGEEHTKQPETSQALRRLLNHTMFKAETRDMEGLDFIRRHIKQVEFRKYKQFNPPPQ